MTLPGAGETKNCDFEKAPRQELASDRIAAFESHCIISQMGRQMQIR